TRSSTAPSLWRSAGAGPPPTLEHAACQASPRRGCLWPAGAGRRIASCRTRGDGALHPAGRPPRTPGLDWRAEPPAGTAMQPSESPEILRWETLTKRRFDEIDRARAVVLVTCSPLEVHGPHLPLGADILEGEGLAERAMRFLPEAHRARPFLKLPCI